MYIELTIIIAALLIAAIGVGACYFFLSYKKKLERVTRIDQLMQQTQNGKEDRKQYVETLRNALKQLCVKYEEVWLEAGKNVRFTYQYQSGNFSLLLPYSEINTRGFSLHFPFIYTDNLDKLQAIRTVCNESNNVCNFVRASYYMNEEESKIDVHLTCYIPFTIMTHELVANLTDAMQECFVLQRIFVERIEKLDKEMLETHLSDLEYAQSDLTEQTKWVNQAEARLSQNEIGTISDHLIQSTEECLLGDWLNLQEILPNESNLLKMICEGDDGYQLITEDEESIINYCLVEPIVHQLQLHEAPKAQTGSIRVAYQRKNEVGTSRKHWLTLYIENLGVNNNIIYIRLNYMLPEKSTDTNSSFKPSNGYTRVSGGSLVIGYDWKDGRHKRIEFDYMWDDAQDKIKEGDTDQWTPEQEIIHTITQADLAYDIYWGKRFTRQKRYYEAALHLSRAYNTLSKDFYSKSSKNKDMLFEVSFMLGHCYNEMKQYKKAFFYLQTLSASKQTPYIEEMIISLVALKDIRSEQAIRFYRSNADIQINECIENEKEVPKYLKDFHNFLRRQFVHINVERHFFEKAEEICHLMLDENENKDFALSELKRIQCLREKGIKELKPIEESEIEMLF